MSTPATTPGAFSGPILVPFLIASVVAGGLLVLWAFYSSTLFGFLLGWVIKLIFKSRGMLVKFSA